MRDIEFLRKIAGEIAAICLPRYPSGKRACEMYLRDFNQSPVITFKSEKPSKEKLVM